MKPIWILASWATSYKSHIISHIPLIIGNIPHRSTCLEIIFYSTATVGLFCNRENKKKAGLKKIKKSGDNVLRLVDCVALMHGIHCFGLHVWARCAIAVVWFELGVTRQGWNVLVQRLVPSALLPLSDVTRQHSFPCSNGLFFRSKTRQIFQLGTMMWKWYHILGPKQSFSLFWWHYESRAFTPLCSLTRIVCEEELI